MSNAFNVKVRINGEVPAEGKNFLWVEINLDSTQEDETRAYPSIQVSAPIEVTAQSNLASIEGKGREKARKLLADAIASL